MIVPRILFLLVVVGIVVAVYVVLGGDHFVFGIRLMWFLIPLHAIVLKHNINHQVEQGDLLIVGGIHEQQIVLNITLHRHKFFDNLFVCHCRYCAQFRLTSHIIQMVASRGYLT